LSELKRRKVFRVAALYAVGAWGAVQVADATFDVLGIPASIHRILIIAAVAGFPIALVTGWLFDWSSSGLVRTSTATDAADARSRARGLLAIAVAVGSVAAAVAAWIGIEARVESTPERPASVVVLPFDDLAGDPDQEYFAHGMSEELRSALGRLPTIRVIGRTTATVAKKQGMDVEQIGRALGATAVVEGTVRRSKGRVRIALQMSGTKHGASLWSDTYDRTYEDIFKLQEEIAVDVAAALDLRLRAAATAAPTESFEAYDAYLTGRHLLGRQTNESMAAAAEYFERAVRADPNFALAWSGLSDLSSLVWTVGFSRDPALVERAIEAANRAVAADPESAEAQTSLARTQWMRREWRASEASLRKAIELNPGYGFAYQSLALVLINLGEFEAGLAASHRSVDLEPLSPYMYVNLATSYAAARDHEGAIRYARRATELEPFNPVARGTATMSLLILGREGEELMEFIVTDPTGNMTPAIALYKEHGASGVWRAMFEFWDGLGFPCAGPAGPVFYAQLGRHEEAVECIERAIDIPGVYANIYIASNAGLDPVRKDPRFVRALAAMGLPH
jgi:TolB-like protein/Tfp pilus assembly protein PilF